ELICHAVGRHMDAGLRRSWHPWTVRQGRDHQGRTEQREERLGARTGYLRRERLLRAAREMDRLEIEWLAGLVGRAARELARRPVGAESVQGTQGHNHTAVRLLPRLLEGSERHAPLPIRFQLDRRVREA